MPTATLQIEKKKTLVPKLRFQEFESPLAKFRMDDVVTFKSGGTPSKEKGVYWNGDIPWISATSMQGKYYSKSERTITEEGLKNGSKLTSKGTLLLLVRGSMLFNKVPIGITERDVAFNQDLKALIPNKSSGSEFLYQWFCAKQQFLLNKVTGTGIGAGKLDTNDLSCLKIYLPTLSEQQKIASFLSAVDEKIQQLSRKKELLEQYKKGVMQQLFSGKLRFKDQNVEDFADWEEKKLGDIAERNSNKNKGNQVNFVLTNSATQGVVSQADYFDREIANQNNLEGYYIVEIDDFVYNPRISVHAPVGPIKRNKLKQGVMSPLYSVFRFKEGDLHFFEYYFETIGWHEYLESISNKGARHDRMNITNNDFFKMPISFPCIEEQQKIANFLSSIDTKIESVNKQITQTQTFKKGLLQGMFV
jgi:type I restriction enzyme S subunit